VDFVGYLDGFRCFWHFPENLVVREIGRWKVVCSDDIELEILMSEWI
jgi:hypothetical protein